MLHERARVVHPTVNAIISYGLSSAGKISDQVGIEKTHVKIQYNDGNVKDDKSQNGSSNVGL